MFFHLSVNAARQSGASWGDTQYAEGLGRAIRALPGCDFALLFRNELPPPTRGPAVVLRIIGPHLEDPVPGLPNILWMISPPNLAPIALLARYQAIFCASTMVSQRLRLHGIGAEYLPQATEIGHFHPGQRPSDAVEIPLVFVGGYAPRADRALVKAAVAAGAEPQIWGPGWQGVIPDRLWRGERLDYAALAQVYASARIVLNSHMQNMADMGFMSNRSYDALASGAQVISDRVRGFDAPDLPELRQIDSPDALPAVLKEILERPALDRAARAELHQRVARLHGFEAAATAIVSAARRLVDTGATAVPAFRGTGSLAQAVPAPKLSDPAASATGVRQAMAQAASEILQIARWLEQAEAPPLPLPPSTPADRQGVIHAMMPDLRAMQRIAAAADRRPLLAQIEPLAARARRMDEVLSAWAEISGAKAAPRTEEGLLARVLRNAPLWAHVPAGFRRDSRKVNVPLWPRNADPAPDRPIGVFLHLYHEDLASVMAERLEAIPVPFAVYASTDTEAKARRIAESLPGAEIRVLENRGRDIWPKLYGFGDRYDRHDIVLHLHGKKSPHSNRLDAWLDHILRSLLGSRQEASRILSFFDSIPRLGMVTPAIFQPLVSAAHWGDNQDLARELAGRMGLTTPLPDDDALRFPAGSMFWARTAAIRPLLELNLRSAHFPPEAGQVDGTLAHAIERMLGVCCQATGHHILAVSGRRARVYPQHQRQFSSNGELRKALESGALSGAAADDQEATAG